jgi:hypothetical protein
MAYCKNNDEIYTIIQKSTDARVIARLIKAHGAIAIKSLFDNCKNWSNDIAFWRDIHHFAFLDDAGQFTKVIAKHYIAAATSISEMIDESCSSFDHSNEQSYREYWRNMFMNFTIADHGTLRRIIDYAQSDDILYFIITNICDVDDARNILPKKDIPCSINQMHTNYISLYYVPRDVNMFIWLHNNNYIDTPGFIVMFKAFIINMQLLLNRNICVYDYLRAIYIVYPSSCRAIIIEHINKYTQFLQSNKPSNMLVITILRDYYCKIMIMLNRLLIETV